MCINYCERQKKGDLCASVFEQLLTQGQTSDLFHLSPGEAKAPRHALIHFETQSHTHRHKDIKNRARPWF